MSMVALASAFRGMDPWKVMRMPGAFVLGPDAVNPPGLVLDEVVVGLLMHLWLGILVGLAYAALLPRLRVSPVQGGLIAGALLYGLGFWLLPHLFPAWLAPFWLPAVDRALQAAAHAVYGASFGVAFQRFR